MSRYAAVLLIVSAIALPQTAQAGSLTAWGADGSNQVTSTPSMGGFAALHFGFSYPDRCRSIVVAGCGYGAAPGERAKFAEEAEASAKRLEELTMKKAAEAHALGPTRRTS